MILFYVGYGCVSLVYGKYISSADLCTNICHVFTSGEDSRVHESGHAEVCESEEEDYGIVDGNDRGKIL